MSAVESGTWPEGVIARYLTVGGATVDITYTSGTGNITATCTGERCPGGKRVDTEGLTRDTPEQEAARVEEWLPTALRYAQDHAETCRALPRPDGAR